jgi:hypothetical protein
MSRIVIVILLYHRLKPIDLTYIFVQLRYVRYSVRVQPLKGGEEQEEKKWP